MDPNANLDESRELAQQIMETWDAAAPDGSFTDEQTHQLINDAYRLAELQQALDEWIVKGGFIPDRWILGAPAGRRDGNLASGMTVTTTPSERKEAEQTLVYEKALKFVRELAGSHYVTPGDFGNTFADTVDRARAINREAEKAWT